MSRLRPAYPWIRLAPSSSLGNVIGPASSTDNAVVRWDGTGGTSIQDSVVTIADVTGNMAGVGTLNTHTIQGGTSTFALYSNNLSVFAATTSAQLAGVISDETGSGALVFANTPTLVTPILGTPTSGTLTNCTGLPISTGVSGLGAGIATFLATPSSANLLAAVTDETGSGALVFSNSPTLVTPTLGTPSSGTLTNCTGLPVAGGGTGVASFTAYAVICGGTTSTGALQSIVGVGTSGQVLTSNGAGALPTFQAVSAGGDWVQLGTTELSAAGATLEVTGLSARRFLVVMAHVVAQSGGDEIVVRFNGDSAANYSIRRSSDGGADATAVSQSGLGLTGWGGTEKWLVMHIANRSATRKNIIGELHVAGSASAAPDRMEFVGVWDNTAAQITQVSLIAGGTTTFGVGSRIVVYGSSITG